MAAPQPIHDGLTRRFRRGDWAQGYAVCQHRESGWPWLISFLRATPDHQSRSIFRFDEGRIFTLGGPVKGHVEFPGSIPAGPYTFRLSCVVIPHGGDEFAQKHTRWQDEITSSSPEAAFQVPKDIPPASPETEFTPDVRWRLEMSAGSTRALFELPVLEGPAPAAPAAPAARPLEELRIEEPGPGMMVIDFPKPFLTSSRILAHRQGLTVIWEWPLGPTERFLPGPEIADVYLERGREKRGKLYYDVWVRNLWNRRFKIGWGVSRSDAEAAVDAILNLLTA